jgi:hypothetical protein
MQIVPLRKHWNSVGKNIWRIYHWEIMGVVCADHMEYMNMLRGYSQLFYFVMPGSRAVSYVADRYHRFERSGGNCSSVHSVQNLIHLTDRQVILHNVCTLKQDGHANTGNPRYTRSHFTRFRYNTI